MYLSCRLSKHNTPVGADDLNPDGGATASILEKDGFAILPVCLDKTTVEALCKQFDDTRYPQRNLLSVPSVRAVAGSKPVRDAVGGCPRNEVFRGTGNFLQQD